MSPGADLATWLKAAGATWSASVALLTAVVYLTGYLVVRSHMTTWGIGIERSAFDFRHLFSGGSFFLFLGLNLAPLAILLLLGWLAIESSAALLGFDLALPVDALTHMSAQFWLRPAIAAAALAFLVAWLAPALSLRNLPLLTPVERERLFSATPAARHYREVLLNRRAAVRHARIIVGGAGLFLALALTVGGGDGALDRAAVTVLGFAAAAQLYLLPIHYGAFYHDQDRPLLAAADGASKAVLLYRGEAHVELLVADEKNHNRLRIQQRPVAKLDDRSEVGIVRLGLILFEKEAP